LTLRTIEEGGPDAAELRQEWQAEVQRRQADPESQLRAARLQRAALLSSVVGMAAPGEEIGPVQLVADGPPVQVVGDLEIIPLRTFAGLVGPVGYAEAADILLLRAVGGEAGQKAALAFRGLRRSLMAGQARKGIQLSPVGSAEGEHPGSPGGSPVLDAGGGGAGEDRA
jgi:hypothetical protein